MKSALLSRILLLLAAVVVVAAGCRKIKQNQSSTSVTVNPQDEEVYQPEAGYGGEVVLKIRPNHDTLDIDSCKVYVKFNAGVVPQDGVYDDSVWAQVDKYGVPYATFKWLKPGNYYLYGVGWDIIRSQKVRGGLYFVVDKDNPATTHSFELPLQEYE